MSLLGLGLGSFAVSPLYGSNSNLLNCTSSNGAEQYYSHRVHLRDVVHKHVHVPTSVWEFRVKGKGREG
jgi:hypothetical protein